ncbi:tetratricopeptide repeat protein [Geodermatophilus ruber]|uniref:tetratricopeptide repeat protein n=1 Tax=Geodermatophilus ruber TaxID=504800 RepID=UPI000B89EF0D
MPHVSFGHEESVERRSGRSSSDCGPAVWRVHRVRPPALSVAPHQAPCRRPRPAGSRTTSTGISLASSTTSSALAPHLPRYRRSVTNYARLRVVGHRPAYFAASAGLRSSPTVGSSLSSPRR